MACYKHISILVIKKGTSRYVLALLSRQVLLVPQGNAETRRVRKTLSRRHHTTQNLKGHINRDWRSSCSTCSLAEQNELWDAKECLHAPRRNKHGHAVDMHKFQ